jgi:hypothetical protein
MAAGIAGLGSVGPGTLGVAAAVTALSLAALASQSAFTALALAPGKCVRLRMVSTKTSICVAPAAVWPTACLGRQLGAAGSRRTRAYPIAEQCLHGSSPVTRPVPQSRCCHVAAPRPRAHIRHQALTFALIPCSTLLGEHRFWTLLTGCMVESNFIKVRDSLFARCVFVVGSRARCRCSSTCDLTRVRTFLMRYPRTMVWIC